MPEIKKYKFAVVGAGVTGAWIARELTKLNEEFVITTFEEALEKLEQLTDRKTALNFIFDYFGEISFKYKAEEKVILDFRTALNNKIEELISNQV